MTNTGSFAAWFVVTGDVTPDGIRVVRSVLEAISSFPVVAFWLCAQAGRHDYSSVNFLGVWYEYVNFGRFHALNVYFGYVSTQTNSSGKCSQEWLTRGTITSTMRRAAHRRFSSPLCKVTPVILHKAVSEDITPCRMSGVTFLQWGVFPDLTGNVSI